MFSIVCTPTSGEEILKKDVVEFVEKQGGAWMPLSDTEQGSISKGNQHVFICLDNNELQVDFTSQTREFYGEIVEKLKERWPLNIEEDS